MPVVAPTDRRFLRARVKPGRRHGRWHARVRTIASIAACALLAGAGWLGVERLAGAPMMRIDRIVVVGNVRLTPDEALALVDGLRGLNVFTVDLGEWRKRVLESPWVADAALRRILPSTVEIQIVERQPVGIGRLDGALYLVDDQGTIIDDYGPRYADLDLPIIDGLAPRSGAGPTRVDPRRARLAGRLLDELGRRPDLARRVSQIDVSDPGDAVVLLDADAAFLRLGEERFVERLQSYLEIASALRERVPDIDYVDLRFGEKVYVGPSARGAEGAEAQRGPRRPGTPEH